MVTTSESLAEEPIVAANVSFEAYLAHYAADFYELENENVIKMSPIHEDHDLISRYFGTLFDAYFEVKPIGRVRQAPFVMKLEQRSREPDVQIILHTNPNRLTPTYMDGAADIVIEIISPESGARDRGKKFDEYEKAGVKEYWLFDPIRRESLFYRLNDEGVYSRQDVDENGQYQTPLLPELRLHVATLWQKLLPGPSAIAQSVKAMLQS